ncbi:ABC transporter substrate-binding protein [Pseudolysinimonas kribbensis]|uniref:ABC transporter substrate-binding protein n=1 Tax=Pseudolysinimonas kribbensis TaxID=433641 RepID=A0ABQ6K079_9MICO|nr:putative F420-0 ABC transporter substrate-binding protein [Pseudolysinimonas kribbensis]GMA94001.1 ABC transporter substrate-binding protein [Pseudolysinimonas kribbensis]
MHVRPLALVAVLAGGALLSGCAQGAAAAPVPTASSAAAAVTVQNCDTSVTFDHPPKRVISIKSTSTEMMLALGVGDRIVGTAYQDGPVPARWAATMRGVPSLSDFMPSEEAVLAKKPDLVYSGWESAFSADQAGTRGELASLGVASYVQPAACRSTPVAKLTFAEVFREIDQAGRIFGVEARAKQVVATQQEQLAGIHRDPRGLTALWYSSGDASPYVGAGTGAPELVMKTAGLRNIAGDVPQTWTTLGWESIVADDPDVIILIDADWNTAAAKIHRLESDPATARLSAVQNHRFITIPFAESEAGVRSIDAARSVAAQLAHLHVG